MFDPGAVHIDWDTRPLLDWLPQFERDLADVEAALAGTRWAWMLDA